MLEVGDRVRRRNGSGGVGTVAKLRDGDGDGNGEGVWIEWPDGSTLWGDQSWYLLEERADTRREWNVYVRAPEERGFTRCYDYEGDRVADPSFRAEDEEDLIERLLASSEHWALRSQIFVVPVVDAGVVDRRYPRRYVVGQTRAPASVAPEYCAVEL